MWRRFDPSSSPSANQLGLRLPSAIEAVRNYRVLRGFRFGEFGRATKDLTPGHRRWDFSPELRTIVGGILFKNWSKSQLLYRGHFESLSINQNRARTVCSAACFEIHTRQAHNLKVTGSNPVPATTFVITHSPSRSNRRDGRYSSRSRAGHGADPTAGKCD
jgi:hypothetical protein